MSIFEWYASKNGRGELEQILNVASQQHPYGLNASFLEKDIWVTEILRLLYDGGLLDGMTVAFKGGTALSKCWKAIERFSEDIDLSIHWADLAGSADEAADWEKTTASKSQNKKFRDSQKKRLIDWSAQFVTKLNSRLSAYELEGFQATLEPDSNGEKIDVYFPGVINPTGNYQLEHILLEFGGRNRGRPTQRHSIGCYVAEVPELASLGFPIATVQAYRPDYIVWEKLTALHQFTTQDREPSAQRLSRHWYDVDCILRQKIAEPTDSIDAMNDVVEMKTNRWLEKGVDYTLASTGGLRLIPDGERLDQLRKDYAQSVDGGMFFSTPDNFDAIIERLRGEQDRINAFNTSR